jgi:hypothetical protein
LVETLVEKTARAAKQFGRTRVVLGGGVACNRTLVAAMQQRLSELGATVFAPSVRLATDNAAMIARAGLFHFQRGETAPLGPPVPPHQVGRDPEEPWPRIDARAVERPPAIEGADEGLGCDLFGERPAKAASRVGMDGVEVPVEDRRELVRLSERPLDHGRIGRLRAHIVICPFQPHEFPAVV